LSSTVITLDRIPEAVRQLAHRARAHAHARRPRAGVDTRVHRAVTERFLSAALGGDLTELIGILAPDVQLWTDSGAVVLRTYDDRTILNPG
jgi:RNA polymerase sigma-70 factor (ECF subfamily)